MDQTNDGLFEEINKATMENQNLVKYFLHAVLDFFCFFVLFNAVKMMQYFQERNVYNKYIIADDYYNETGEKKYLNLAKKIRNVFLQRVGDPSATANFIAAEKKFRSAYWPYEKRMKERILKGEIISTAEIRKHLLFKSSDVYMNFATFQNYSGASKDTIQYYHYIRALAVLVDDMKDVQKDLEEDNPNCLLMILNQNVEYEKLKKNRIKLLSIIRKNKVTIQLDELKKFLQKRMEITIIPKKFFLPVAYLKYYNENQYKNLKKKYE